MPHNYGKLYAKKIIMPKVVNEDGLTLAPQMIVYQPVQKDTNIPWKDVAPEIQEGIWYIVVMPDGFILNAEEDATAIALTSTCDVWQIESDATHQLEIMNNKWDGEKIVYLDTPPAMRLDP